MNLRTTGVLGTASFFQGSTANVFVVLAFYIIFYLELGGKETYHYSGMNLSMRQIFSQLSVARACVDASKKCIHLPPLNTDMKCFEGLGRYPGLSAGARVSLRGSPPRRRAA